MMRLAASLAAVLLVTAARAEDAPKSGAAHHLAYAVCRSVAAVDLGDVGSDTAADCTGIVKSADGKAPFDNLALHCLEGSVARKAGYKFTGTCVETDSDGDRIYLSYEGPEDGPVAVLGGTGKFAGLSGKGHWKVTDAPGNTAALFAFTLDYTFDWTRP